MRKNDKTRELLKERDYLSAQLEKVTKELSRLDLLNLTLTQQKRQAIAAFNFITIMEAKIKKAFTIDNLYLNVVKAITSDLFMDSSAFLRINYENRDISILASSGLLENLKCLKLDENISEQETLKPTFVDSKSSLQTFHKFIISSFKFPFFIWYPILDEEDGMLVLFVGNRFEDLMSKQPFSETSLETFGAISAVILLRRGSIIKTQEMLRRKEERIDFLAEILKTSPISVIAMDWDAKMIYVNPATEEIYGYKAEELIGKDPLALFSAEPDVAEIQKKILNTIRQGKVWRGETLNKKKNGDLFYSCASIYQLLDKEGNFIAFVGFKGDITERKQAEEALCESEKKYRNLVDNALVGIYKTNLKGDILYVNEALWRMLEFESLEEMKAEGVLMRYKSPLDRNAMIENLKNECKVKDFEVGLLTKTGKTKEVFLSAILDSDIISGMVMDITERKQIERERRDLLEKLRNSQEQLQGLLRRLVEMQEADHRFLAGELHDQIGQNLTGLSINLNIIYSQFSGEFDRNNRNKKMIKRIEDSLKLVEDTIERIRNIMAGLHPPVLEDYGLLVAMRWYSERFSERTGVSVGLKTEELSQRLPLVVETALFRIFQEVLTNVAKHAEAKNVSTTLQEINGRVRLSITDDGIGFAPADIHLKEKPRWGLITMEERAKALGGDLHIESVHGKGTRVIVELAR
jgi:PAS domain S-box-containing protein